MDETRPLFYLCKHLWPESRNKKFFLFPSYKCTRQSGFVSLCVCRKYWRIVQHCYWATWLIQSQPDNTTERYRHKEMLVLVSNRYSHYIWRYHISEARLKNCLKFRISGIQSFVRREWLPLRDKWNVIHKGAKSTGINNVNFRACDDSVKIIFEITRRNWGKSRSARYIWLPDWNENHVSPPRPWRGLYRILIINNNNNL